MKNVTERKVGSLTVMTADEGYRIRSRKSGKTYPEVVTSDPTAWDIERELQDPPKKRVRRAVNPKQ